VVITVPRTHTLRWFRLAIGTTGEFPKYFVHSVLPFIRTLLHSMVAATHGFRFSLGRATGNSTTAFTFTWLRDYRTHLGRCGPLLHDI